MRLIIIDELYYLQHYEEVIHLSDSAYEKMLTMQGQECRHFLLVEVLPTCTASERKILERWINDSSIDWSSI